MGAGDGPQGIDVSSHQSSTPSLTGLDFLIARASIGTAPDTKYDQHIAKARAAGLLVGAYHFNWKSLNVADQVHAFLSSAGDVDFYFLDVEGSEAFSTTQTKDFIARVHDAGKPCGLYMSESVYKDNVGQDYHWVANWSKQPSRYWHFWQWQGSPLDRNTFNGGVAEMRALAGGSSVRFIKSVPGYQIAVKAGTKFYLLDGADSGVTASKDMTLEVVGSPEGSFTNGAAVIVSTGILYSGDVRPTVLHVKQSNIVPAPVPVDDTPFSQADLDAAVAAAQSPASITYPVTVGGKPAGSVTLP